MGISAEKSTNFFAKVCICRRLRIWSKALTFHKQWITEKNLSLFLSVPQAVKRSREKTRQLAQETRDRLNKVTEEADRLEIEVISRRKELQSYKNLFYKTLEKKKENGQHIDMKALCDDDDPHIAG